METPFLSQAYVGRSRNLVFNQAVNIYPEIVDDKSGKRVGGFYGCPGSRFLAVVGTGPHRGARVAQANGGLYCVSGSGLYQVSSGWAATLLGTLSTSGGPVAMMDGTEQIVVVDGSGSAYVWNFSTSAFSTVALGFNADTLFSQDGFFLANQTGTSTWWQSNLNDGSTWNALNFSSASAQPDPIVGGIDINREAWLMKANGIEIWYNAGNLGFRLFPYSRCVPRAGLRRTILHSQDNHRPRLGRLRRARCRDRVDGRGLHGQAHQYACHRNSPCRLSDLCRCAGLYL